MALGSIMDSDINVASGCSTDHRHLYGLRWYHRAMDINNNIHSPCCIGSTEPQWPSAAAWIRDISLALGSCMGHSL